MSEAKDILNSEIKLINNFGIRDLGFFSIVMLINYFLLIALKLDINSAFFIFCLGIETFCWVILKSLSIKDYSPYYYINLLSFYLRDLKHCAKDYYDKNFQDTEIYYFKDLINYSLIDENNLKQINRGFSNLIKNLYKIDSDVIIRFRILTSNEGDNENKFHPKRTLYLEIKNYKNLNLIEEELKNFREIYKLNLDKVSTEKFININKEFTGIKVYIKERKDYLKSKYFISNLEMKYFNSDKFSLNELIKKIPCKNEVTLSLYFQNHEKIARLIKFKKNIIKYINPTNTYNKKLLKIFEQIEKTIYKDETYLEENIQVKLICKSQELLKINESSLSSKSTDCEFVKSIFSEFQSFKNNSKINTVINLNDIEKHNPFIEDKVGTPNGPIIACKTDDNSLVRFNIFNKKISNNYSINFIGDSGSGKSLAAKLLLKRLSLNTKNKFIIIDSSIRSWEHISEALSGNCESFTIPENIDSSIKSIEKFQVNLFNFYEIEKNLELSQAIVSKILEEINKLVRKQNFNYILIIDEAWKLLIKEDSKVSSELLSKIARTGRSMNVGLWTISQKPKDINRDIHSNSSNSFIFQIKEANDKDEITKYLSITEKERKILDSFQIKQRGFALMKNQYFSGLIKFIFKDDEYEFLNSEHIIC